MSSRAQSAVEAAIGQEVGDGPLADALRELVRDISSSGGIISGALLGFDSGTGKITYRNGKGIVSLAQGSVEGKPSWLLTTISSLSPIPLTGMHLGTTPALPVDVQVRQVDATHWEVWLFNTTSNAVENPSVLGALDFASFGIVKGEGQSGTAP